jgi:hypothetical protein
MIDRIAGESPGRSIKHTSEVLDSYGYDSYMMIHQRLIKLTGVGCWNDRWNMDTSIAGTSHAKPNILCVRRNWELKHAVLSPFVDPRAPLSSIATTISSSTAEPSSYTTPLLDANAKVIRSSPPTQSLPNAIMPTRISRPPPTPHVTRTRPQAVSPV